MYAIESELYLKCCFLVEGGKQENSEKNSSSEQRLYQTRATMVGGENSHHYATQGFLGSLPCTLNYLWCVNIKTFESSRYKASDSKNKNCYHGSEKKNRQISLVCYENSDNNDNENNMLQSLTY